MYVRKTGQDALGDGRESVLAALVLHLPLNLDLVGINKGFLRWREDCADEEVKERLTKRIILQNTT